MVDEAYFMGLNRMTIVALEQLYEWQEQLFGGGLKRLLCGAIWLVLATGCIGVPTTTESVSPVVPSPTVSTTPLAVIATATRAIPSPSPNLSPVCEESYGRVEEGSYPGRVLTEQIPVRVYLPPCYYQENRLYPVLYLLHGSTLDESQWGDLGVDELADDKIGTNEWPSFIIVMPRQPEPLLTGTDGGPESYEAEFVEGLLPYIEGTYRTDTRSVTRALGGVSRGGVWALEIAFRYPEMFDIVVALSPALHVNYARPMYDPFISARTNETLPSHIFLSAGEADGPFREKVEALSRVFDEVGAAHTLVIGPGGHDNQAWRAVIEDALDFVVAGWFPDNE